MQTMKMITFAFMAAALLLAACVPVNPTTSPPPGGSSDSLEGTSWILVELNGQPVASEPAVTVSFDNGAVSGSDGCNQYSSTYTSKGETISVDPKITSTMMACAESVMQQATAYTTALTQAASFKIVGDQLTLMDANGKTLATFTRQSSDLGGTSWLVLSYNNGKQAVVSVMLNTQLTADFGVDGKLSGSAGCNNYNSTYETSGKTIKIGPAATTRKMCSDPAGVMEQETQYLQALSTAATYSIDGNKLEMRTAEGAMAAQFTRNDKAAVVQNGPSILEALPNAEYPIEGTTTGLAKLKDGLFEEEAAPGSATKNTVRLGAHPLVGDVNGDGTEDAVVTLVVDPGGSGTFSYLALVLNENGEAKPTAAVLLGDRIKIKSLKMDSGDVVVTLLTRKPDEPMSAEPTVEVTRTFTVEDGKLAEVK